MFWLNGQFVEDATIAANGAGLLLGWGVFTTIGIWNARPFALDFHLQRLRRDAARCDIEYSMEDESLREALHELIARNAIVRGIARITLTKRGDGRWNTQNGSDISILTQAMSDEIPPAKITLSPFRAHSQRPLAGVKSTSYLDDQLAWREAHGRGFDEAILFNEHEQVCEGARSNVFWVSGGKLFTPSLHTGCLPGIARHLVLHWARESGLETYETEASVNELVCADVIFITSAATGVRRVSVFGDRKYPSTALPSEVTTLLQQFWQDAVS